MPGFVDTMMRKGHSHLQVDYSLVRERDFNQIVTKKIVRLQLREVP